MEWNGFRKAAEDAEQEQQGQRRDYHGRFAENEPTLDAAFLKKLIMLCHPDKHGGSTMSNEVTKVLLTMKEKMK